MIPSTKSNDGEMQGISRHFTLQVIPLSGAAVIIVIVDFEFQYRAHTGKAVEHRGDERQPGPVSRTPNPCKIESSSVLTSSRDGCFALLDHILWTANGMCRI